MSLKVVAIVRSLETRFNGVVNQLTGLVEATLATVKLSPTRKDTHFFKSSLLVKKTMTTLSVIYRDKRKNLSRPMTQTSIARFEHKSLPLLYYKVSETTLLESIETICRVPRE